MENKKEIDNLLDKINQLFKHHEKVMSLQLEVSLQKVFSDAKKEIEDSEKKLLKEFKTSIEKESKRITNIEIKQNKLELKNNKVIIASLISILTLIAFGAIKYI